MLLSQLIELEQFVQTALEKRKISMYEGDFACIVDTFIEMLQDVDEEIVADSVKLQCYVEDNLDSLIELAEEFEPLLATVPGGVLPVEQEVRPAFVAEPVHDGINRVPKPRIKPVHIVTFKEMGEK